MRQENGTPYTFKVQIKIGGWLGYGYGNTKAEALKNAYEATPPRSRKLTLRECQMGSVTERGESYYYSTEAWLRPFTAAAAVEAGFKLSAKLKKQSRPLSENC